MILNIAWKNVWRNKARSLVIISAVTVGLFGGIFSYALMMGGTLQRIDNVIKNETSAIQLHNPALLLDDDIKNSIANPEKYNEYLNNLPDVKGVSDRLKTTAMISTAYASSGVVLNGIYAEEEMKVSCIYKFLISGSFFQEQDLIPIVIGKKLAQKLNAEVGDKLIISAPQIDGNISYGAFLLKGIYHIQNDLFDGVQVFVKKTDLARLVGVVPSTTSEIAVSLNNPDLSESITQQINTQFEAENKAKLIIARSWKEIDPTISLMIQSMDFFSWIFVGIILIALAFGIVNTMLMVVLERVREIGMLMAVGMNKLKIFSMIMWETIFLSMVGGIVGMIISSVFIAYFQSHGLDLSAVALGLNAYGISSVIYPEAPLHFYIEVSFMIVVTAILASIYPALKALKLHPAEAIRE